MANFTLKIAENIEILKSTFPFLAALRRKGNSK
jgi:hypothetical protein